MPLFVVAWYCLLFFGVVCFGSRVFAYGCCRSVCVSFLCLYVRGCWLCLVCVCTSVFVYVSDWGIVCVWLLLCVCLLVLVSCRSLMIVLVPLCFIWRVCVPSYLCMIVCGCVRLCLFVFVVGRSCM